jgi:YhcH/YjgK/YiaL family protein
MILDSLSQGNRYSGLHPIFPRIWEILADSGLSSRPTDRYPIDETDSYYLLVEETGKGEQAALLESHRRFIDIHVTLRGEDMIGWRPVAACRLISQPYDTAKDATLYRDRPLTWSKVMPGLMAIFFPDDAHAPLAGTGELRKAIFKIAC